MVNVTHRPLYLRERIWIPIDEETWWAPGLIWKGTKKIESLASTGVQAPDRPGNGEFLYRLCRPFHATVGYWDKTILSSYLSGMTMAVNGDYKLSDCDMTSDSEPEFTWRNWVKSWKTSEQCVYRPVFEPATSQSEVISVVSHCVSQLVRRVSYMCKINVFDVL